MAGKCFNEVIDRSLRNIFYKLGVVIGHHPGYFIVVPILLTALCATGVQRMKYNYDPEYLFSPTNGQGKHDRGTVEKYFPTNYTEFKASRMTRAGKLGRLIITAKDNGSMLRTDIWDQLLYLDQVVYNITVKHEDVHLGYFDLCAQWNYNCYDNEILRLSDVIPRIESKEIQLTYPITFHPDTFEAYTLPAFFGGEIVSEEQTVTYVKAVALSYFLDVAEDWKVEVGNNWEMQFLEDVKKFAEEFYPDLDVGMFVSNTPAWEMENSKISVTSTLIINTMVLVLFSFIAPFRSDNAKSKPLIGFFGLFAATLATIAGFGFCCYIGVEFISLNFAAPFLLFGIGVDDTFVVLSSWHRSSPHLSVPERMGSCFSDAAVSITVTSLTNFFSFIAGVLTPFPCVRIFCLYTGISVAFIYIWHITLFGGILALAGRAEKNNRHGLLACFEVTPKSLAQDRSWLYRTFMTGGINPNDPHNPVDNKDHCVMVFFRDRLGGTITKGWVKCLVLLAFVAYMAGALWGFTNITEGLEKKNTANYDSYSIKYYDMDDTYFKKYAFTISVVFSGPNLDFSNVETQRKIEHITKTLENSTYIDAGATQNWLRDFLDYIERQKGYKDVDLPISTEHDFANTLSSKYLTDSTNPTRLDVAFDENRSRVVAARFLIQGLNINNSLLEQKMVEELREICVMYSTEDLQVTVFQPFFVFIDQYIAILPQAIQTILITALVMVIIALILIPSIVCSIWVSFSIVSIEIGVIGFMTLWGINLDGVALINLIMCIGFSVDFSAHICYHYMTAEGIESDESPIPDSAKRIRASLYALGLPIIQGAASTILGVFGLMFANCYLFVTFFKMIFLVILLGALHGLILLPVLLSIFGPDQCRRSSKNSSKSKKLQSYESSAISTPTITTFSKRQITNNFHINSMYNGFISNNTKVMNSNINQFNHTMYDTDEHDGIESICSCTINMGYINDKDEPVEGVAPTTYFYEDSRKNRSKYPNSAENQYDVNLLRNHKRSKPFKVATATETTSTEQSSPSTLSTSSNAGRRIPRVHRHLPPHARISSSQFGAHRAARYRQQRHAASKALNLQQGGMLMLKNGVVLSPSQLMVLTEGNENAHISNFHNEDGRNKQLAVVVVEDRSSSINAKRTDIKMEASANSEMTPPTSSTSSSSSSSPSNMRSSTLQNCDDQNVTWEDKLHRTSAILPGRVTKHVASTKQSASNASPRNNSRHGNIDNHRSLFDNHPRHRKVIKTRSHHMQHKSMTKNKCEDGKQQINHMLYLRDNQMNFTPKSALHKELGIKQLERRQLQKSSKKCVHKTKSDFVGRPKEGDIMDDVGQVVPIENILTLSNNFLATNSTTTLNNSTNVPMLSSAKQPLKKANTFPYEKLHNDTTSYSSDNESMSCDDDSVGDGVSYTTRPAERWNRSSEAYIPNTSVFIDKASITNIRKS